MNPTAASIDSVQISYGANQRRVEAELFRLLQENIPGTVARDNAADTSLRLEEPVGYLPVPADLTESQINHVLLHIKESRRIVGVQAFASVSDVRFFLPIGRLPITPEQHDRGRWMCGIIVRILGGETDDNEPVAYHWQDPDSYKLWAELVTWGDPYIVPFTENKIYGHVINFRMTQYPGENGTTT